MRGRIIGVLIVGVMALFPVIAGAQTVDDAKREKMRRMLDVLDRGETLSLTADAFDCVARKDFACGKDKLDRAARLASGDDERRVIASAQKALSTVEAIKEETEAARRDADSARQRAQREASSAQAARRETDRQAKANNWSVTSQVERPDKRGIVYYIRCGDGRTADIQSSYGSPGTYWTGGRGYDSAGEAAAKACGY